MVREHRRLSSLLPLFRRLTGRPSSSPVKPVHGTPLLTLPDALIIAIACYTNPREISHLLLANRRLSALLTPILYDTTFDPYSRSAAAALYRACKRGDVSVVQHLLDHGVSMVDPTSWTGVEHPLHTAAREGQSAVVRAMLAHEDAPAAALIFDTRGYTPFHLAALNGFSSVTKLFLDDAAAAAVTQRSDAATTTHAATALHFAAAWGHAAVVRLLLDHGAPADTPTLDRPAHTPLHWALQNFCSMAASPTPIDPGEVILALLARGADIARRDATAARRTVLHFAATSGDYSPQRRFGEHYSQIRAGGVSRAAGPRGRAAAKELHRRVVALLVAHGADIDAVDGEGRTALYHAAEHGEEHFVRNFAELGADVGVRAAASGLTALEMVVAKRLCGEGMEMAEALLDHGAVVELGRRGRLAAEMDVREREALAKFVKSHEAKMRKLQASGHHGAH